MLPILLFAGIDAGELIGQPLERLENWIEECLSFRVEHLAKVNADRFCNRQQGNDVENELSPT